MPVRLLGRLFRVKYLAGLCTLYDSGQLRCGGSAAALPEAGAFRRRLTPLYGQNLAVYAKPPFRGTEHIFRYLGRYSHRLATSNARLVSPL